MKIIEKKKTEKKQRHKIRREMKAKVKKWELNDFVVHLS